MTPVRQTTPWSCFAASLAMLTGIDYDIMPKTQEAAPGVWPSVDGMSADPDDSNVIVDPSWTSVFDWAEAISDAYEMTFYKYPIKGVAGVLSITVMEGATTQWSHAVHVDERGHITCPSAIFDDMHLTEIEEACNIFIAGFITVEEK